MNVDQPTRRQWFMANVLVTWREQVAPPFRKAYRKGTDTERIEALRGLRRKLEGWIASIDSVLSEGDSE